MKTSQALEELQERARKGGEFFTCNELRSDYYFAGLLTQEQFAEVGHRIRKYINGESFIGIYLDLVCPNPHNRDYWVTSETSAAARYMLCKSLAAEFRAKGD